MWESSAPSPLAPRSPASVCVGPARLERREPLLIGSMATTVVAPGLFVWCEPCVGFPARGTRPGMSGQATALAYVTVQRLSSLAASDNPLPPELASVWRGLARVRCSQARTRG